MTTTDTRFPNGFRWGTATAAHQIEGGNWNNDWWRFEHTEGSGCAEPSGDACDSWNRWADDVALVDELGLGTYRFSLEWSRIEPEPGEVSRAALDHYRRQCEALRERDIEPIVTFHHFTNPRWFADRGGWEAADAVDVFGRYCEAAASALSDVMAQACTINEPNMVAISGWLMGIFPPGRHDPEARHRVDETLIAAHRRAVDVIRAAAPRVPVGLTLSMTDYQATDDAAEQRDHIRHGAEDVYLDMTEGDDFLGIQTYTRMVIGPHGWIGPQPGVPVVEAMGYEFWPDALEACLRRAWEYTRGRVPLWVTENGIGTDDDSERIDYVHRALLGVLRALADGIDVRGYTYWSLLDNFEWAFGYRPRFGLVEVDRTTFGRDPKSSARWFAEVAAANALVDMPA